MAQHWTHQGGGWLPPRSPLPGDWFNALGVLLAPALLTFPQLTVGLLYADRRLRREHLAGSLRAEPLVTGSA
ncbi:hypothetical protein [Streptomyces sp. NPDC041003]|uniref:hypothetical protein n=1 Tax=Streptomyces sp. NPDC041003 TaxID=3155730 RepID=UPI0033DDAB18